MRDPHSMRVGFIGAGNMAEAMMTGMAASGVKLLFMIRMRIKQLPLQFHAVQGLQSNIEVVSASEAVFLAVKPDVYSEVLQEIAGHVTDNHIITIAPGITKDRIRSSFSSKPKIIRMMPNTPSLVHEGMIALSPDQDIDPEIIEALMELLSGIGIPDIIDEKLMDAVTGLSGSGPAYAFLFIEAMADGAVLCGMPRDKAYLYASQTLLGASRMVKETGRHPALKTQYVLLAGLHRSCQSS